MKTVYFILGMHRSGTSALSGVLDIIGLELGSDLMPPNNENEKGYFENNFIVTLNEKILTENNSSWDDKHFNIASLSKDTMKKYVEEAKKIINSEFQYAQNFAIKDPRICLLFPIWEKACQELNIEIKTILPYRNPMEVALSLKKRDNFPIEKGLLLWINHFLSAEYFSRKYERMFLFFDDLLSQTKQTVDELYEFTEFKGQRKRKDIDEFLDKNIKHNNIAIENFTKEVPRFFQELLNILQTKKFDDLNALDTIRNDFNYSQKLFQYNDQEQKRELETLKEKVRLLEQIKDVAMVDEDYYLQAYPDLSKFDGSLSHHYFNHGKHEKRKPNEYCAVFDIDTKDIVAKDEETYLLNSKLQNAQNLNAAQNTQIEEQTQTLQELQTTLNAVENQKAQTEEAYQTKLQEIESLNQQLNELVEDLAAVKESKETLSQELNEKLQNAQNLNAAQNTQIEEQTQRLQELQTTLNAVENQKAETEEAYQNKLQEIESLNQQLNELVEDLATVKESKETLSQELNEKLQNAQNLNAAQNTQIEEQTQTLQELQTTLNAVENQKAQTEEAYQTKLQEIESLNQQLNELVEDLATVKESKETLSQELNEKLQNAQNLNAAQNTQIEEQTQRLQELQTTLNAVENQKAETEEAYQNKLQEIESLNQQLNELVEDLATVKESKETLSQELNEKLQNAQNLNAAQNTQIEEQTQRVQELQTTLNAVENQKAETEEAYQNKLQEIELLNQDILSLKEVIIQKEQESLELNRTIDTIVNDLASIKESKCWIYTKPLRDIQKVFKGSEDE